MYADRTDAGLQLANALQPVAAKDTVVLGVPRGGVVVASALAHTLGTPLGLVLACKICHPTSPEYAIGAIAEGEQPVYNLPALGAVEKPWLIEAEAEARKQIARRRKLYYKPGFRPPVVAHKTAILVDDGMATGLTMAAAIKAVRSKHPERIIVAVPVASRESIAVVKPVADEMVVLDNTLQFGGAIASRYHDFHQVTDRAVQTLLQEVYHEI